MITLRTVLLLAIVTAFFRPVAVWSQGKLGIPLVYSKADFHGGSHTLDIKQDSDGKMYFANTAGLLIFDGSFWRCYTLPNKTYLRSIYIDSTGLVYAGGQDEFGYFSPDAQGVLRYTSLKDKIPPQHADFADVWTIAADGTSVFFRANDRIFQLKHQKIGVFLPKTEWVFMGAAGGQIFAQDKNNGLLIFRKNQWEPVPGSSEALGTAIVSGVFEMGKNSFLFAGNDNTVWDLRNNRLQKRDPLPGQQVLYTPSLARINDSLFVTATSDKGCLIKDAGNRVLQQISSVEGLQGNNVKSVFVDKDRNIWAGIDNGICFINYNSPVCYLRPNRINDVEGFSTRIFNDHLYLSTSNGVYMVPLGRDKEDLSTFNGNFSLVKNSDGGEAWRLEEINGQLLLAHNNGVYVVKGSEAVPVAKGAATWMLLPSSRVFPAESIIAGTYSGLDRYSFNGHQFKREGKIEGQPDSYRFLAADDHGDLWASHPYRGIYRLRLSQDLKSYTSQLLTQKDGLPSAINNYVYKIRNSIVFATVAGIYEFDRGSGRFVPSKSLSPVFKNMEVRYMSEDADGNIWFSTGDQLGVADFSKPGETITYFPELAGKFIQGFENIYPYNKHNIFIGSEKGTIHLNYARYAVRHTKVTVLLGLVKAIGNKDSVISGGYLPNKDGSIELPSQYKSFHFEYSSPAYDIQNSIEYSYRLDGYDPEWSAWSTKTEKDYTNLPAGHYRFKIKARDNLNNESAVVSYSFIISPPWYRTVWAWASYVVIVLLLAGQLYNWQERRFMQQQRKFDEEQKRTRYIYELELEKNEKEIVKLQNEKLEQEILLKNKELASTSMHLAGNAQTLGKIKGELDKLGNKVNGEHEVKHILTLLKGAENNSAAWEQFAAHFDELNDGFLKRVKQKYPGLSYAELKVCAFLRLNMSSKEIARQLNISVRGVELHRYRVRKKLGISTQQSLAEFLSEI